MILKALTLENFKGIREPVRVEFAPLTLLFGPNNAGKSTIVQALMYSREVLERNNCDVGRTQLGGDVVDLGGFKNLVHGHDLGRVIRMKFELDLSGIPLPKYSDWVREHELESIVWDQFNDAPKKIDIASAERVHTAIREIWVQVEIGWRAAATSEGAGGPVVQTYSVGRGQDTQAKIVLDDRGQAVMSEFGFGVPPFGVTYYQGDASDFEWTFAWVVRGTVKKVLQNQDSPRLGLEKGATVAMPDEECGQGPRRLSREDFDKVVSAIVDGVGDWGDSSIDEETGTPNPQYQLREALVERAAAIIKGWRFMKGPRDTEAPSLRLDIDFEALLTRHASRTESAAASDSSGRLDPIEAGEITVDEEPVPLNWDDRHSDYSHLSDKKEIESWMLDLFDALVHDDYVPSGEDRVLPLRTLGTALPEWGRTLEPHGKVWLPDDSEKFTNEFWEFPAFAQEYLKDLLTTTITGPGELLLRALKGSIYVSPFREMPPRHYQPARSPETRRWANGLAAWDWLLLEDKSFAAKVNTWLVGKGRFDAGYELDLRHYRELESDSPVLAALTAQEPKGALDLDWVRSQVLELPEGRRLTIRDLRTRVSLFPQDLGVGMSQVIPVIVAALHNRSGIVAIEEPESNIHPAFQVVLADLFIIQAKANPDVLFLVETHSEHLMLRCLRRIRESGDGEVENGVPDVRPEDIAVHFVEAGDDGPRIHRIRIDEDGEFLDPWPRGFFPERMKEIYGDDS